MAATRSAVSEWHGSLTDGSGRVGIRLEVSGDVPGLDADGFREAAETAKDACPVSQALAAVPIALTVD
jgi:osmotically inducible protein OsmC